MFNAFLTTALEVIVLLDILGAIVYFIISGIVRARKQSTVRPAVPVPVISFPAGAPAYTAFTPATPYFSSAASPSPSDRGGWSGLRGLRDRFSRKAPASARPEQSDVEAGHRKIGTILNSFKEDI